MTISHGSLTSNLEQVKYWNSSSGEKWVKYQDDLDNLLEITDTRLIERAAICQGERVLDVGCGTGATTMSAAHKVGSSGSVVGVDISRSLLECAINRIKTSGNDTIEYLLADAQTHAFRAGEFDLIISRLGMMFFEDPISAFRNLANALRDGGRLSFACWASASSNPWFRIPRDAAIECLGKPAPTKPAAPGPLAFSDLEYVSDILTEADLKNIQAVTEKTDLFFPGTLVEAASLACSVGPAVRIVKAFDGTDEDIKQIELKTVEGFRTFVEDGGVRIPASMNFFDVTT